MKHVIDDQDKNKYEAYTKQEVLELIQEVAQSGELPEELNGLVITLKNPIDNQGYKIAFCSQAEYNELEAGGQLESNCYYYITDDTSWDDFMEDVNDVIENMQENIALLPRTQELMQQEASENQNEVDVNALINTNDYIEVTGYIKDNDYPNKKFFVVRLKKNGSSEVNEGHSLVSFGTYILDIYVRHNVSSSRNYISFHKQEITGNSGYDSSNYTFKILNVKELINY